MAVMTAIMMIMPQTTSVVANASVVENLRQDTFRIKLQNVAVDSNYEAGKVSLVRTREGNITVVKVIEKKTQKILEEISERVEPDTTVQCGIIKNVSSSVDKHTYLSIVDRKRKDGPIETTLSITLQIYSEGSFRQINKVSEAKIYASGSSSTTLESKSASCESATGKYPCVTVNYAGSGVITGTTTVSASGSYSIDALGQAGFSVTQTSSKNYFYRKYVVISGKYSLY